MGKEFPGVTMVLDPRGRIVAEAKPYEEDIVGADLRYEDLLQVRKQDNSLFFLRYRRPALYDMLVERTA